MKKQKGLRPLESTLALLRNIDDVDDLRIIVKETGLDLSRRFGTDEYSQETLLSYYIHTANIRLVKALIEYGVDIEKRITRRNLTPLHYAVTFSSYTCVYYLLDAGANVNVVANDGCDILSNARDKRIIELLIDAGVNVQPGQIIDRYPHEYYALVQKRISSCRQSLLTMMHACTISRFRPLVEMLLSAARQSWVMRGGEGCGPRGHHWELKKN